MHGNVIFGHFEDSGFRPKIEKCKQFSKMVRFWTVASKIPPSVVLRSNLLPPNVEVTYPSDPPPDRYTHLPQIDQSCS